MSNEPSPSERWQETVQAAKTQRGNDLLQLSEEKPVLVVFLRHFGCTFCREAVADIAKRRRSIEAEGVHIVFVHMGSFEEGLRFFEHYGLGDIDHVSDPKRELYQAFGLKRGNLNQMFGVKNWWRGFEAGVLNSHAAGKAVGDVWQMPGVFLVHKGEIIRAHRHEFAGDRPDYENIATCAGETCSVADSGE
jgi:peroxiredoxin